MSCDTDQEVQKSIIDSCLRFDAFNCFYQNESMVKDIKCVINPSCPMFAAQLFDQNRNPYIEIRKLPETFDDVFLVAHEMGHAIRYFDKQYLFFDRALTPIAQTYFENEIVDMGNKLGSMVDDPLIDSFLKDKYGFDPAHFYKTVLIPDVVYGLELYGDPIHEWNIFKKALFYSQFSLQCDLTQNVSILREWDKLKNNQYKTRRPKTAKVGEELYSITKENGYNTIEKQRDLFNIIFNRYTIKGAKLGDILRTV